jgi:hypothetical protein
MLGAMEIETGAGTRVVASMDGAVEFGGAVAGLVLGAGVSAEAGQTRAPIYVDPPTDIGAVVVALQRDVTALSLRLGEFSSPRPRPERGTIVARQARIDDALRALGAEGQLTAATPRKIAQQLVARRLGLPTAARGVSEDTVARRRRKIGL